MYGDADWCGTSDCGGCGTLVADLAREALDEEDSLRPSEVGDAQAFDSLLGTCDAVANEMNSMLRQMESMAHEMYNSDEESEAGRDNSKNDMQVVVEDVVSCCDSMYNEENNQRPGEGESFMVPNDTFLESLQPLVDRLRHDDTSLGSSGKEFRIFAFYISYPSDNFLPFVYVSSICLCPIQVMRVTNQELYPFCCPEEMTLNHRAAIACTAMRSFEGSRGRIPSWSLYSHSSIDCLVMI